MSLKPAQSDYTHLCLSAQMCARAGGRACISPSMSDPHDCQETSALSLLPQQELVAVSSGRVGFALAQMENHCYSKVVLPNLGLRARLIQQGVSLC